MKNSEADFKALMERYQQELLELRRQAVPVAAVTPPPASESPADTETNTDTVGNEPTAALQVRVTAANQAIPIPGAVVTISRPDITKPLYVLITDISGLTEPVTLPATDPALTQQPEDNIALVTYDIHITAPGYFAVRNSGVPLFGGISTVQPVAMIPLPEFEEPNVTELNFSVPRNNL